MPNLKFNISRHICAAGQRLVRTLPLGDAPLPWGLTYLSKPARGDIGARRTLPRQPLSLEHHEPEVGRHTVDMTHHNKKMKYLKKHYKK